MAEERDINKIFTDVEKGVIGAKAIPTPTPQKTVGIDTDNQLLQNIIASGTASTLDMSKLESFTHIAETRDRIYEMLDTMGDDPTIATILETYAEDATEYNDKGQIVWVDSDKSDIVKYITYLLDTMNVDKNIYKWVYSLIKYGDVYLRLYRESDEEDELFGKCDDDKSYEDNSIYGKKLPNKLNEALGIVEPEVEEKLDEDINVVAYSKNDKYTHYVEMVENPAEMFELMKRGKTVGYIQSKVPMSIQKAQDAVQQVSYRYQFQKNDVNIYGAAEFVHASIEDNTGRTTEEVSLFLDGDCKSPDAKKQNYKVRRGQSMLYSVFKIWRELMLLQNSVLLNRLTKSAIVRIIGVEVGDMAKESVGPHLQNIKSLIEQKSAINEGNSMSEYTNPGPVENSIYVPTRGGVGNITTQQIGGDVDVKSLADLDYFNNLLYGSFRVPKAWLGFTDDNGGFNAGSSLSIQSSGYAKRVKKYQNAILQMLTDAINLMLLDKGLDSYIGKFTLRLTTPATQEEVDKQSNESNKVGLVRDIMDTLSDVSDTKCRLNILKALLSSVITDPEVINQLQDYIDTLPDSEETSQNDTEESIENEPLSELGDSSISHRMPPTRPETPSTDETEEENTEEETGEGEENALPLPSTLGVDFTDNTAF